MKKLLTLIALASLNISAAPAVSNSDVVLSDKNTIVLNEVVTDEAVAKVAQKARDLDASLPSSEPIFLVLDSPGGSVNAGLELIENLSSLNRPVSTVSLFAASMGFHTVQGLGERLVVRNGTLMSHKASGGFTGEFPGQLDNRYNYYLKRITRLDVDAVARTKGKWTLDTYHNLTENEFWCDGQECVDKGFADKVVKASCDQTLSGTKNVTIQRMVFRGMPVEIVATMSKCPIITGVLSFNIFVDGKPLFPEARAAQLDATKEINDYNTVASRFNREDLNELMTKTQSILNRTSTRQVVKGF